MAWPLIGRDRVISDLLAMLRAGRGAVVAGPAGVGKSRLLATIVEELPPEEFEVVEISGAQSAAAIPLAPLLHLVDLNARGPLANLVLAELNRRSLAKHLVVLVDDAQNLDESSAALLHQVATSRVAALLLATRSGESVPTSVTALWKDEHLTRVDLEPLSRRATNQLVEAALGPVTPAIKDLLWHRSHGHPLFLRELVLAAERNSLGDEPIDDSDLSARQPLSDRLMEIINQSLDLVNDAGIGGMVQLVHTQPLALHAATTLVGSEVLDELFAAGLAEHRAGLVQLSHPLYGEAAVSRLPKSQVNSSIETAAESLIEVGGRDSDVATLLLALGRPIDTALLERATKQALQLRQGALALRLADAWAAADESAQSMAHLGAANALEGGWEQADRCYRKAVTLAGDGALSAEVWLGWIASTFEYRDDVTVSGSLAREAASLLHGPPATMAKAWHLRTRMFSETLDPVLDDIRALAESDDLEPDAAMMLELDRAAVCWHTCRPRDGLRAISNGQALRSADPVYRSRAMQVAVALTSWTDGFDAARAGLNELVSFALSSNDPDVALHAQAASILFNARAGRAAATVARNATLDSLTLGATVNRWVSLFLAELAWAQCHLEDQREAAEQTIALIEAGPERVSAPLVELVRSRLALSSDRPGHLDRAVALAREDDLGVCELLALRESIHRLGATQERVQRVVALADRAGPGLANIYRMEAEAMAADDPHGLMATAEAAERFGADGLAWEIYVNAQIGYALADEPAKAFRAEMAMEDVGQALPGQYTPSLDRLEPILTERERQVVAGIEQGQTNKQIAEALYLSPNTVKSHLDRIYKRLGVNNRLALADLTQRGQ